MKAGRGYRKVKEVPVMAGVTAEVGMALEVLVIRTSKANQTSNRIQTSTMTSKLYDKLLMYYYLSFRTSEKCHSEQNTQKVFFQTEILKSAIPNRILKSILPI